MIEITQADFNDWKTNKVTKAFFQASQERVNDFKEMLASSAGIDSSQDRFFVGMIQAYREMQEFRLED
jgi:hypothetical protein